MSSSRSIAGIDVTRIKEIHSQRIVAMNFSSFLIFWRIVYIYFISSTRIHTLFSSVLLIRISWCNKTAPQYNASLPAYLLFTKLLLSTGGSAVGHPRHHPSLGLGVSFHQWIFRGGCSLLLFWRFSWPNNNNTNNTIIISNNNNIINKTAVAETRSTGDDGTFRFSARKPTRQQRQQQQLRSNKRKRRRRRRRMVATQEPTGSAQFSVQQYRCPQQQWQQQRQGWQ